MKRFSFLLIIILFSSFILKAQMNTGSKFVAGYNQFGINSYHDKDKASSSDPDKYFNINLTTKAGYFLKNRIAIGGFADVGYQKINYVTSDFKVIYSDWSLGPLARYYVEYGSLIPFAEISVGFGLNTTKSESATTTIESKHSVFGLKGGIGADYFLNESIAFEGMANYYMNRLKPKGDNATGEGSTQNGFELSFGVIFYFGTI
jgi:hypothetical protein